jgi:HxlR-like helix-turn-helix
MKPWIKYRKHTFLRLSGSLTTVMNGYSTYCPIAKAAEILTERWTLLLVRGLLLGAFNDFRRSIPLMTPAMLSKRLRTLEEVGILSAKSQTTPAASNIDSPKRAVNSSRLWKRLAHGASAGRAVNYRMESSIQAHVCGISIAS